MPKDDTVRLRHMLDAAQEAVAFVRARSRSDLDTDRGLVLSLQMLVIIVGEAAMQVSQARRDKIPQIPWKDVIGMRHRLTHAYMDVDLEVLWSTVTKDLPPLIKVLAGLVPK
jgi:uncharacterized protein with HEPN domain